MASSSSLGTAGPSSGGSSSSSTAAPQVAAEGINVKGPFAHNIAVVEFPGLVRRVDEAIASMGGLSSMQNAALEEDNKKLQLRLCRKYRFAPPLTLNRSKTSDVLVRVIRDKDGTSRNEVVGIVTQRFVPEVLADYVFTPGKSLSYGERTTKGSIQEELSGMGASEAPYMPPTYFTKVDMPQPYDFEDNPFTRKSSAQANETIEGTVEAKLKRHWVGIHCCRFNQDGKVPSSPPEDADKQLNSKDRELVEVLRPLFAKRPAWLRGPLLEQLPQELRNSNIVQKALQMVSYLWQDGPWRGSYSRLGWDPREEPQEAKMFQVLDFRDKFLRGAKALVDQPQSQKSSAGVDCHFRKPPVQRSQLYQLCDLDDTMLQSIIGAAEVLDECHERSGWFAQQSLDALRDRMTVKSQIMRKQFAIQPALSGPKMPFAQDDHPQQETKTAAHPDQASRSSPDATDANNGAHADPDEPSKYPCQASKLPLSVADTDGVACAELEDSNLVTAQVSRKRKRSSTPKDSSKPEFDVRVTLKKSSEQNSDVRAVPKQSSKPKSNVRAVPKKRSKPESNVRVAEIDGKTRKTETTAPVRTQPSRHCKQAPGAYRKESESDKEVLLGRFPGVTIQDDDSADPTYRGRRSRNLRRLRCLEDD